MRTVQKLDISYERLLSTDCCVVSESFGNLHHRTQSNLCCVLIYMDSTKNYGRKTRI